MQGKGHELSIMSTSSTSTLIILTYYIPDRQFKSEYFLTPAIWGYGVNNQDSARGKGKKVVVKGLQSNSHHATLHIMRQWFNWPSFCSRLLAHNITLGLCNFSLICAFVV